MIYHIYFILISYTNNIKLTVFLLERSILLYSEFIIMSQDKKLIDDIFKDEITILGLESEFLENVELDNSWKTHNIQEKWKQTKLSKMVKEVGESFNVFLYSSKHPAWDLFKNIPFDIIILETHKNYEQMYSIILENKIHEYIHVKGLFIRKDFLEN